MTLVRAAVFVAVLMSVVVTSTAQAHVNPGGYRVWIDADLFSAGVVRTDPKGSPPPAKTTLLGIGPNQLGASPVVLPTTPLGVGLAYVVRPNWLLGARLGTGYDRVAPESADPTRYISMSLMPEVTFVPIGHDAKLFVKFSPVLQFSAKRQGNAKATIFMGCFSLGVGTFIFTSHYSSLDIGAYFEGRFGDLEREPTGNSVDVNDLRGLIRGGISLWR